MVPTVGIDMRSQWKQILQPMKKELNSGVMFVEMFLLTETVLWTTDEIVLCSNFTEGKCERSDTECWFKHEYKEAQAKPTHTPSEEQVFQSASPNAAPPDQEQSIMMFLNVVLQKMSKLETMFQQMKQ